jgi:Ricin-type beta-trefoil lectin domain
MKVQFILMLLGVLVVILSIGYYTSQQPVTENFDTDVCLKNPNFPGCNTGPTNLETSDAVFTNAKARRFNNVSDGMNDFIGGYFNADQSNSEQANKMVKQTMNSISMAGSTKTASGLVPLPVETPNSHLAPSDALNKIRFCENLKGNGPEVCDALDNVLYGECGVCLKGGIGSQKQAQVGGLYFNSSQRRSMNILQASTDSVLRTGKPTVGMCPPRNFVMTSAQCRRRREQLMCEGDNAFPQKLPSSDNSCSQCIGKGQTYIYKGSKSTEFPVVLNIIGPTSMKLTYRGQTLKPNGTATSGTLGWYTFQEDTKGKPIVFKENETMQITTTGAVTSILTGTITNSSKTRSLSIYDTVINKDSVVITGTVASPLITNAFSNAANNYPVGLTAVKPKTGKDFNLTLNISGFLGEPDYDDDANTCPAGALLGTDSSMRAMQSNPCYATDPSAPLSQSCVSNVFLGVGGTTMGNGYPSTGQKTQDLLALLPNGQKNNIDALVSFLSAKIDLVNSGKGTDGQDADISTLNSASMYMLGIEVSSPCDLGGTERINNGPLSDSCLAYLYNNSGVGKKEGATYTGTTGTFATFCNTKGTASPIDKNGAPNASAIGTARSKGGVRSVQSYFNSICVSANTAPTSTNSQLVMSALGQCYGIVIPNQSPEQTNCEANLIAEFDMSKSKQNTSWMARFTMDNTVDQGPMSDVEMILNYSNWGGNGFSFKPNTIIKNGYNTGLSVQCRRVISVAFWVKSMDGGTAAPALIDLRNGGIPDSLLFRRAGGNGTGSYWNNQNIYIDGTLEKVIPWGKLTNMKWHFIVINLSAPFNGEMDLFSIGGTTEGWNVEFGPIRFYQQTMSDADIQTQFRNTPEWATTPRVGEYQYQGCFWDNWNRALPFEYGASSQEQCAQIAANAGMNAFGLQDGRQCFIGNYPQDNFARYGNTGGECGPMGNGWINRVYYNSSISPTMNNSSLVNGINKCIDIYGASTANGANTIQWDCHGGNNQRFTYNANDKTIKVTHSGKCLSVTANNMKEGGQVLQYDCTGSANQKWDLNDDKTISLSGTDLSLTTFGANNNGAAYYVSRQTNDPLTINR